MVGQEGCLSLQGWLTPAYPAYAASISSGFSLGFTKPLVHAAPNDFLVRLPARH
jgi:hypothetical protein